MSPTRRRFLITVAAGGAGLTLVLGAPAMRRLRDREPGVDPWAWLGIAADGSVTVTLDRTEMGQGVLTALPMLVAEELEVPWQAVRVAPVVEDPGRWSREVGTGASRSVRGSWELLRTAGAAAREMLTAAAAAAWQVPPAECTAVQGIVRHDGTGRRAPYGSLAGPAARLPVPSRPALKAPAAFRLIGTSPARLDTPPKTDGSARFGMDIRLPGMLVASIERAPVFGATVARFDPEPALAVPGVRHVIALAPLGREPAAPGVWRTYTEAGVAVLADDYWRAVQGRRALGVAWHEGPGADLDSATLRQRFLEESGTGVVAARSSMDATAALARAPRRLEAVYEVPLLHHATLEPMNCTADVRDGRCEVWAPLQKQTEAQRVASEVAGVPRDRVRIHTTMVGGGFGRRQENDFVAEAVRLSREVGRPVQVIWSREDDTRHGFYRPASCHRLAAGLDEAGNLLAWSHRIAGLSLADWKFNRLRDGVDRWMVESAADLPYGIPAVRVTQQIVAAPVPRGFFRSTGASFNAYVTECFLDECARTGGRDPYQFRRSLLREEPRLVGVLDRAAEAAGWGRPLPEGRGRGIAVVRYSGSVVAMVAEVELDRSRRPVARRYVCAIDCGPAVHPDIIASQMESAVAFGLSAALYGEITIERGRVRQSNFHDYRILRLREMPPVEVHLVPSRHPIGGVGDPATPPVIPAFCNAILAASGSPVRRLPLHSRD